MKFLDIEKLSGQKLVIVSVAAVLFVGLLVSMLWGDSHRSVASAIERQAIVTENYIKAIESANNANDMSAAIVRYTDEMKILIPEIRKFNETYAKTGQIPEATARDMERMQQASVRLSAAMMKTFTYMSDEKVQKSMERMGEELGEIE